MVRPGTALGPDSNSQRQMEINPAFRLEGVSRNRRDLIGHCREIAAAAGEPAWKREVCLFVVELLENPKEPVLQKTSGTTGDPTIHSLEREAMEASARMTLRHFGLRPGDSVLLCLPVRYVAGKMIVVRALVGGLDLHWTEPSSRPMKDFTGKVSFASMVPLQARESILHGDPLERTGILLLGGGEVDPGLREDLKQLVRPAVCESFAMTETYTHFALRQINGKDPDPLFRSMAGVSLDRDERGCLVVEVPGVTRGQVVTSDLVELHPDGQHFRWLGRYDHVISSGGIKILPEAVEEKIRKLTGEECLILPEPDPGLGQRLVLLVETGKKTRTDQQVEPPFDEKNWAQLLKNHLQNYEVPRRIIRVEEIPRNASFKPDRVAARRLFLEGKD